jgi:hypothetical protein
VPGRVRTFLRMRGGACQPWLDDDEVRRLLAIEHVLQRHQMRLGRIAAQDNQGL